MLKLRQQEQLYRTCIAYNEKWSAGAQASGHPWFPQAQVPHQALQTLLSLPCPKHWKTEGLVHCQLLAKRNWIS